MTYFPRKLQCLDFPNDTSLLSCLKIQWSKDFTLYIFYQELFQITFFFGPIFPPPKMYIRRSQRIVLRILSKQNSCLVTFFTKKILAHFLNKLCRNLWFVFENKICNRFFQKKEILMVLLHSENYDAASIYFGDQIDPHSLKFWY